MVVSYMMKVGFWKFH